MNELFMPSNLPWDELTAETLEELIFWLMDAIGAKDLEWRKGGKGITNSDGGRDIQATFHVPSPDGEFEKQNWWIEVKKRNKTLEKSTVQSAIINTQNSSTLDVFVIATNSQLSNPTIDWIKDWQIKNPRPKIKLWDKDSIERMLIKHPSVVVRIWDKALSPQGKLEALSLNFWNKLITINSIDLNKFWLKKTELNFNYKNIIALVSSEFSNGDINTRRWLTLFNSDDLSNVALIFSFNFVEIIRKSALLRTQSLYLYQSLSSFIIKLLLKDKSEYIFQIFKAILKDTEEEFTKFYIEYIINPVFVIISEELQDICHQDCPRINSDNRILSNKEVELYWNKFKDIDLDSDVPKKEELIVTFEKLDEACGIGLKLNEKDNCPIFNLPEIEYDENFNLEKVENQLKLFQVIAQKNYLKNNSE